MKSYIKIALVLTISLNFHYLTAQQYTTLTSAYNHLYEVNKEWAKHQNEDLSKLVVFDSENDRINFHLKSVIHYLSEKGSEHSIKSQKKRFALLKTLEHYADQKVFPKNIHHASRRPYFIDHEGTHCAVGYLMAASGSSQLAQQIKLEHNYDYIRDIKTKGVAEWAKQNGFSIDELALIQPGYTAPGVFLAIDGGVNGPIKSMVKDYYNNQIIFAGQFDMLNNMPCLNIGIYKDGQLNCFGEGVAGVINNIIFENQTQDIIVTGALVNDGITYPMAIWDGNAWSFYSIPGREGAICSASLSSTHLYFKKLAISHPSIPNQQEIWVLKTTGEWEKKVTVNGMIFDIEPTQVSEAYVGHFNTATHHRIAIGDTTFTAHNIVMRDYFNLDHWFSIDSESNVSDTIKVAKKLGTATYFGGTCLATIEEGGDDICVSRYLNGVLQPIILTDEFTLFPTNNLHSTVNAISLKDNRLLVGGLFNYTPLNEYYSQNYAEYDLVYGTMNAVGSTNGVINDIIYWENDVFIGGDFTRTNLSSDVFYFAKTNLVSSTEGIVDEGDIKLFPNPATDNLTIEGLQSPFDYQIIDIKGSLVQKGNSITSSIQLNSFTPGVYIVNIVTETRNERLKFVKQ